jgi:LysM repeat protein
MPVKKPYRQPAMVILMILTLGWTACSQAPVQEKATPTPPGFITPYWTRTPTQEITPAALSARTPTPIPTPTPTPVTHRVIEGETMLGIALRYGISLEELMVANPEVDPRFLSIDTELVIPLGESAPPDFVMPTPIPVGLGDLTCYPTADGGAWCFWPVDNQHTRSLENLSARIILYSIEGDALVESLAIPPLNLIPGGQSLPLVAFFPPPLPDEFFPQGELLTALPVRQQDERYLEARLEVIEVAIDPSGLIATLHGTISLPEDSAPAGLVWLAAVAYGEDGRVAGLRKWEAGEVPLEAGERSSFELDLFSLGPPIQEVEVLVEARP